MQEMYAGSIDFGAILSKTVQLRLAAPPVVAGPPICYKCLELGQEHALRPVVDGFAVGTAGALEAKFKIIERGLWGVEGKRCHR
jgi:hypothetical protein